MAAQGSSTESGPVEPAPVQHPSRFRPGWLRALRRRVVGLPAGETVWRVAVAVVGAAVIALGMVMLPLPGPGWAVIFLGLGLWATEFHWAQRLLLRVRRLVLSWTDWLRRQARWVHVVVGIGGLGFTAAVLWLGWQFV